MVDEIFIDGNKLPKKLTKQEIHILFEKYKNGDEEARQMIIVHNVRFVLYEVVHRFKNVEYDKKDLVQVGNMGLINAIDTFDVSRNIDFLTYAIKCIDNEILMFLRKMKKYKNNDSIDRKIIVDDCNLTLKDVIESDIDIANEYNDKETYQILRYLVDNLPEKERKVVMLYFGFYDGRTFNQQEIASMLGVSQSKISRMISKIVQKLGVSLKNQSVMKIDINNKKSKIKKI